MPKSTLFPCNFTVVATGQTFDFEGIREYLLENPGVWEGVAGEKKSDRVIDFLDSLLDETEGATGLNAELYRAAIQGIKAAYLAGKSIAEAINEAIEMLVSKGESREEAEKAIRPLQAKLEAEKAKQSGATPPPTPPSTPSNPLGSPSKEPRQVLKTIEGKRIMPSETMQPIKDAAQRWGLYRNVQNMDDLFERATNFVSQVGEEAAEQAADDRDIPFDSRIAIYTELLKRTQEAINSGNLTNEEFVAAAQRQASLLSRASDISTEGGRVGPADAQMYRVLGEITGLDFSYEDQKKNIIKAFGEEAITESVEKNLREMEARYIESERLRKELEKKLADLEQNEAVAAIREAESRETKKPKKRTGDAIKEFAKRIRGEIKRPAIFQSASPGQIAWDAAREVAATTLEAVGETLNAAEALAKAIQAGIESIRKSDWYKSLDPDTQKKALLEFRKAMAMADVPDATVVNGNISVPNALIRHYIVNEKMTEIDEISARILEDLKEANPDFEGDVRDVRDAISGYARKVNPTKKQLAQDVKDINEKILELKSLGKMLSTLEDIQNRITREKNPAKKRELTERELVLKERIRQAEDSLKIAKTPEQKRLEALQKRLDDLLMGKVPDSRTKLDDTQEMKDLKEEIFKQKQRMGLIAGKRLESEVKRDNAIRAIEKAIADLNQKIASKDFSKSQTTEETDPEILAAKEKLQQKREEYKALKESTGEAYRERLAAFKERAKEMQAEYERRTQAIINGEYRKPTRASLALDEEARRIENEKFKAKELFDIAFRQAQDANENLLTKGWYRFSDLTNFFKQIMAGVFDLGVLAIQGKALAIRYPGVVPKAMTALMQGVQSEENYNRILADIKSTPMYRLIRKSGLDIVDPHSDSFLTENASGSFAEQVVDALAGLPAQGLEKAGFTEAAKGAKKAAQGINIIKKLNRAQTAYMNVMRFTVFSQAAQKLLDQGYSYESNPEMFKGLADSINTLSGRARIFGAERSRAAMSILNIFLFAPRNLMSNLLTTTPAALGYMIYNNRGRDGLISEGNRIFLTTLLADYAATTAFILAFKALAGWDNDEDDDEAISVSLDPTSSNFMKVKVGNQVHDFWGGKQSSAVLQARLAAGALDADYSIRSATTGIKGKVGGPEAQDPTYWDVLGRYIKGKMNPAAQLGIDYLQTKKSKTFRDTQVLEGRVFDPFNPELITPMTLPSLKATYENPNASAFLKAFLIPSLIVGAGHTDLNPDPSTYTPGQALQEALHPGEITRKQHERAFKRALKEGDVSEAKKQYQKATTMGDMAGKTLSEREKLNGAYDVVDGLIGTSISKSYGVDAFSEAILANYVFDYYPRDETPEQKQRRKEKYEKFGKDLPRLVEGEKAQIRESFKMKGKEIDNVVSTMEKIVPYPEGRKITSWGEYVEVVAPWYKAYKNSK